MIPRQCPRCAAYTAVTAAGLTTCSVCGYRSGRYRFDRLPSRGASHPGHTNPSKPSKGSRPSRAAHK
jgi:hypothetical protein